MTNLKPGQLCRIRGESSLLPLKNRCWVVLKEHFAECNVWSCWPVISTANEEQGCWDVLIDVAGTECAKQLDGTVVIAQAWNSVILLADKLLPSEDFVDATVVKTLDDVDRDWMLGPATDATLAKPGAWLPRRVGNHTVTTGTPLGDEDTDGARWAYGSAWFQRFELLRESARKVMLPPYEECL